MSRRATFIPIVLLAGLLVARSDARSQMWLFGGNELLTITSGTAGSEPIPVSMAGTTLLWFRQSVTSKITVSTSCPGQRFSLSAEATNISSGVSAGPVPLHDGMLASNFITDIPSGGAFFNTCTVRYTASATFAQGNSTELGNDVHSVRYTILAQ